MPSRFEEHQDKIFSAAFAMSLNQKMMKKIEKEYLTMKSKKTEDEIEIKVQGIISTFLFLLKPYPKLHIAWTLKHSSYGKLF